VFQFMKKIFTMPFPWNLWVMVLGVVNLAGGIYFFDSLEGKLALISILGAMVIMQVIFSKFGFVRLLGLGHIIFWVPFVSWCVFRILEWNSLGFNFRIWLCAVIMLNSISLAIDFVDVWRYHRGERAEM